MALRCVSVAVVLFWGVKCLLFKFSLSFCVQIKLAQTLARETINMHNNNVPPLLLLLLLYTTQLLFMLPYSKMLIVYNHHVICDAMCVLVRERKKIMT